MDNAERYTVQLERVGFNKEQAEVLMNCQYEMMKESFATKLDISELKAELGGKIDSNERKIESNAHRIDSLNQKIDFTSADLKSMIFNTKNEMIIKLGAMMISGVIITIGSMGLMFRLL